MKHLISTIVVLSSLTNGCASDSAGPAACEDLVASYVQYLNTRCGFLSAEDAEELIRQSLAQGGLNSCEDVRAVRDVGTFYDMCLPAIEVRACDGMNATLPDVCRGQLLI